MPQLTVNQALQQAIEHQNHGRLAEAEKLCRMILATMPDQPDAFHLLGLAAHEKNDNASAEQMIRKALTLAHDRAQFRLSLGLVLQAQGKAEEAIALYRQILAAEPASAEAFNHLGVAFGAIARFAESADAFSQALRLTPEDPAISGNLGIALCHLNRFEEGAAHLRTALARAPQTPDFHAALGKALQRLGQNDAALASCRQAIALDPSHPHAHACQTLSEVFTALGCFPEAAAEAKLAADALPDSPDVQLTYGSALEKLGRLDDAAAVYRNALQRHPHSPGLHNNLANVLKNQGLLDDSLAEYRKAIAADPTGGGDARHYSNLLFSMQFHANLSPAAIFEEHRKFNELHALPLAPPTACFANDRSPNRRLRVGYIGMQFVAGYHLYSLFAYHDKSQFEIFCYSNTPRPDSQTERFRQAADHWRDIRRFTDQEVADLVRADNIDILVDLSLHMGGNRILVFARKPAPVQISYFGYPGTTGLTAIDYRITDRHLEPPDSPPAPSSEIPLHLPDTFWCYHPQVNVPINDLPAISASRITFGNLNNFCKVNEPTMELWARIMQRVPGSRIILMAAEGSHRDRTRNFFQSRNIAPGRIDFVPFLAPEKYFRIYHLIDLGLDSFPYNGHTTSLDAFYMGVPVLTIIGNTPVSRAGWSQLVNLGLPELAAKSPDDFVTLAVALANDPPRLASLRQTLRPRMAASPLLDAQKFARNIEHAYRTAWHNWCK